MVDETQKPEVEEQEYDMDSMVDAISTGLGFGEPEGSQESEEEESNAGTDATTVQKEPEVVGKADDGANKPAEGEQTQAAAGEEPPTAKDEAPNTWRGEVKTHWEKLPPEVKAEIRRREEDFHKGIEQYKVGNQVAESFREVISPFLPALQYHQINPMQHVQSLLQTYHNLATGSPQTKLQVLQSIAEQFGVDIGQQMEQPYVDPQFAALQKEVNELRSLRQQEQFQIEQTTRQQIENEVNTFVNDPANIYARELIPDMQRLIQTGFAPDLQSAYAQAMRLNPSVAAREAERISNETAAAQAKQQAEKLAEAKKAAAANVSSRAKNGSPTAPVGTMDETIREAYARITNQ